MSMFRKKEDSSSTASYGGVDDPSLRRKSGITAGRVINSSIAIDFGCILVAGLIVIGLLAHLHEQLKGYKDGSPGWNHTHHCVLFGTCDEHDKSCTFRYSETYGCDFAIYSTAINAGVALVFIVISIARVIMAFDIWVTVIAEVVVLSVCVVLSFVVGVTISIGLLVTCSNLQQQNGTHPSCDLKIPNNSGIYFYSWLNSAQAAAWFVFTFLAIALVLFIIRLVIFCRRRQKTREDREILTAEDRPPEDDDSRPI